MKDSIEAKVLLLDCLQSVIARFGLTSVVKDNNHVFIYNGQVAIAEYNLEYVNCGQLFDVLSFIRGGLDD